MQTEYWRLPQKSRKRRFLDFIFGKEIDEKEAEEESKKPWPEPKTAKDKINAVISLDGVIENFSDSSIVFIAVENDFIFFNNLIKNRENFETEANPGIYCIKDDESNMQRRMAKMKAERNEKIRQMRDCRSSQDSSIFIII